MGNSCCQEIRAKRKTITLLLVGLDNAGKTVTAKNLAGEGMDSTVPTVGFSIIPLKYSTYDVRVYDLGGGPNIRGIWHKYFVDVHGIIFIIDSTDFSRFKEVHDVLKEILSSDKIIGKPLLILANKQDQDNALDEIDVIEYLEIESLANNYQCPTLVQSCAANESYINKIEPGIKAGYEWLINYIIRNYQNLNIRVEMDMLEQSLKEKEIMLEKIRKIQAEREITQDEEAIVPYSEYVSKMNGDTLQKIETNNINRPNTEDSTTRSSSSSSTSFPSVYHISSQCYVEPPRPKSAAQIVSHQLRLNSATKRSNSARHRTNKTAPVNLYQHPNSAKERRTTVEKKLRPLKSADDTVFTISNNKVGPDGDYFREFIGLGHFDRLPPLKSVTVGHNCQNVNAIISVVDVE